MPLDGDSSDAFCLTWDQLSEKHHLTCADIQEATEFGAYGVAILLVRETKGKSVVQRAAKGPGFDFWVGDEEDQELPFQGLTRLEVSGILKGDDTSIRARVNQKKKQVIPSDGGSPAIIAVVDFGIPLTRIESK